MAKIKVHTHTEVVEKKVKLFTTTDGQTFKTREKAENHQYTLDYEEIRGIEVPCEIKLSELVEWANDLVIKYGPKAKWVYNTNGWGESDNYMVVKKKT